MEQLVEVQTPLAADWPAGQRQMPSSQKLPPVQPTLPSQAAPGPTKPRVCLPFAWGLCASCTLSSGYADAGDAVLTRGADAEGTVAEAAPTAGLAATAGRSRRH